jgi:pimeloyl-ACP methyl ester carboxylesterase
METVVDQDVVVDGVRIAYRDGEGDGRPVVLVHGTPSHSYIWREVIPPLESEGYRLLAFDLLGYGRSERPVERDTSVAAQARMLATDIPGADLGIIQEAGHFLMEDAPEKVVTEVRDFLYRS